MTPPPAGSVPGDRFSLRTWTLLAAVAAVWLLGLTYPLLESTEGRYASMAAEMAWSGNWLDPAFNGIPHFTKPPLAYWFGALGVSVFGRSAFAVRLPATLALALCVFLVWRLGRRLGLGGAGSAGAAVLAALSPLAVAQGRITSSDIFLWIGVLAFYLGLLDPPDAETAPAGSRNSRRALLAGFGLGWGFLAKGPPVLLWTLLPVLGLAVVHRVRREGRSPWRLSRLGTPAALGVALIVALPWYVIEVLRHPGLLGYWLGSETADRFLTTSHGRSEPFWYFALLLPGAALPWLPELVRGGRRAARRAGPWILVFLWIALPVVFLSFSGSKRPNYLLPAVAPLALLAGLALENGAARAARIRLGVWAAIVLLSPAVLFLAAPPTRKMAAAIRESGRSALLYRTLPSSLPFYLGHAVPMAGVGRAHRFGTDDDVPRTGNAADEGREMTIDELARRVRDEGAVVLLKKRDLERLRTDLEEKQGAADSVPGKLSVLREEGRLILATWDTAG